MHFQEKIDTWSENEKALPFLLCLSAIVKGVIAWTNGVINPDGVIYIEAAGRFAAGDFGRGFATYAMPAYPLALALVHVLVPDWVAAAKLVSVASLVLVLIPLFLVSRELFGRKGAFWAALAFAVLPHPSSQAMDVIRDPLFLLFFAWAVYFMVRAVGTERPAAFLLAALFAWLCSGFRVEGFLLIPVFSLYLLYLALRARKEKRRMITGLILWLAVPLLVLMPVAWAVFAKTGAFNRVREIVRIAQDLVDSSFFENYQRIYGQLKALEASSNYPGGQQNFAELARHYMPLIYLLGLFHLLVKVVFPLFLIPIAWGLKHALDRKHALVLLLFASYMALLYLFLLQRDFLQSRFLLTPAFLLFPWLGFGMSRLVDWAGRSSRPGIYATALFILFLVPPLLKCTSYVARRDPIIRQAGEWLGKSPAFRGVHMTVSDSRIPFYAGRQGNYTLHPLLSDDYAGLEKAAIETGSGVVVVRTSAKHKKDIPDLETYRKLKEFIGRKDLAVIYCRPGLLQDVSRP